MPQNPDDALRATRLYTDNRLYAVIKIPPLAFRMVWVADMMIEPFCALIIDKDEVTLIVPVVHWEHIMARVPPRPQTDTGGTIDFRHTWEKSTGEYRLITFDAVLEPSLTGYMARISAALAEAGVPIMPLAAYSRDHILVPASRFTAAWDVLTKLVG